MGEPSHMEIWLPVDEYIVYRSEPGELKHLSTRRKRNQLRFPE